LPLGIDANADYEAHTFTSLQKTGWYFTPTAWWRRRIRRANYWDLSEPQSFLPSRLGILPQQVKSYGQSDDITVVAIEWLGTLIEHESVATGGNRERSFSPTSIH
jgi:hypothetical protein